MEYLLGATGLILAVFWYNSNGIIIPPDVDATAEAIDACYVAFNQSSINDNSSFDKNVNICNLPYSISWLYYKVLVRGSSEFGRNELRELRGQFT